MSGRPGPLGGVAEEEDSVAVGLNTMGEGIYGEAIYGPPPGLPAPMPATGMADNAGEMPAPPLPRGKKPSFTVPTTPSSLPSMSAPGVAAADAAADAAAAVALRPSPHVLQPVPPPSTVPPPAVPLGKVVPIYYRAAADSTVGDGGAAALDIHAAWIPYTDDQNRILEMAWRTRQAAVRLPRLEGKSPVSEYAQ